MQPLAETGSLMKLLAAAAFTMLGSSCVFAQEHTQFNCAFERKDEGKTETLSYVFLVLFNEDRSAFAIGNSGALSVEYHTGDSAVTFLEHLSTGAVQSTGPKRTEAAYMDISKNTRRTNRGVRDAYGTGSSRTSKGS